MKQKRVFILLSFILILVCSRPVYSEAEEWDVFSSRFCTVFYEKDVDLQLISRRVNLRFSDFYSPRRFIEDPDLEVEDILVGKFDAIFNRVEEVLDMYPSRIHVAIKIFKTKKALDATYEEIFGEANSARSFYIYKTNTIYTVESEIDEAILAHEMAHCVIDHYFVILPSRKIQEILAVYADVHLKD